MEIKRQLVLRSVAGEHMLVPVGATVSEYNGIFRLTESGKLLWENIEKGAERDELAAVLVETYSIDCATALEDVDFFLEKLRKYSFI